MSLLSTDKFLERLSKAKPIPGVLLLGSDGYLRDLCRERLIEVYASSEPQGWGVARFSAAEDALDRAIAQAQTRPMLAPRQIVFLEDVEALEKLGDKSRDAALERLGAYLDDPAPFTVLVLEARELDQRMKLAKRLAEKLLVVSLELAGKGKDPRPVAAMLATKMAREMNVELDADAADELADSLDADMTRLRNELDKLAMFVGEKRRITREDVEALVLSAKKYSVWQLADVLAERNRARALEFLENILREGEQPPAVVGAMAWMYRKLIEAQALPAHLSGWQAAAKLVMRPEAAELALRQARRIPQAQLLMGLAALYDADSRLKSGVGSPRAVMEFLIARLTSGPGTAKQ